MYDCIIVGAGPAGLSAALLLGRCRRRVLVLDAGRVRNRWASAVHGFLTRDGTPPDELLRLARAELRSYDTVEVRDAEVVEARRSGHGFETQLADGERLVARKLLLATGVVDELPEIDGLLELYGTSVHHCPYCDGWEHRATPLAAYGRGEHGRGLALLLTVWSDDVVLCTDGPCGLDERERRELADQGIELREERVLRLDGTEGRLERIVFDGGLPLERRALFFSTGQHQHSDIAARLGCRFTEKGAVETGECESTNVPGLFVAGDASRAIQLVAQAAAEGVEAAFAINRDLLKEDLLARRRERLQSAPASRST